MALQACSLELNAARRSCTLGAYLENIVLTRTAALNAAGDAGNNTLTGGAGADQFVFQDLGVKSFGTITDVQHGVDKIVLQIQPNEITAKNFAEVAGQAAQVGADLVLDVGGHGRIILKNTTRAQNSAADFVFN